MNTAPVSTDNAIISAATTSIGGGSTASVFGWIIDNQVLALAGVLIALSGFVVNVIFLYRRDAREKQELEWQRQQHERTMGH